MIKLTDTYYVGSDNYNPFILYKKTGSKDKPYKPLGWYDNIEDMVHRIMRMELSEIKTEDIFTVQTFVEMYGKRVQKLMKQLMLERKQNDT